MKALPHWGWNRILERAQVLNVRRNVSHHGPYPFNPYHRTMRYDDLTAVEQLVQGEEEKERIRFVANKLAQQTMRGGLSAYWWLPLDGIGYSCVSDDGTTEVNSVDLFNLSGLPYGAPHPAESLRH